MAGFFGASGPLGIVRNYHTYVAQDPVLKNIGLASYSRNSLNRFGLERKNGSDRLNRDISEYFGGSVPKIALLGDSAAYYIEEFDLVTGRYNTVTGSNIFAVPELEFTAGGNTVVYQAGSSASSLQDFQEKFDKLQKNFVDNWTDLEKYRVNYTWSKILNSKNGCIKFDATISVLGINQKCEIQLFFQEGKTKSDDRKIAQKGAAVIVDVMKDVTGSEWGYGGTKNATELGAKVPPSEGGLDNPYNTVAAPLDIAFDEGTGKFSAGTFQTLAVLDEALDGVSQIVWPDDANNIPETEFLNGPLRSRPKTARATRVSSHNGNPNLFGPTQIGCNTNAKQKITVVNRSPRKFSKGELILCSRIDGVWVAQGFGVPETVPKAFSIEWSQIQKYIATAPYFLRDNNGSNISPIDYIQSYRSKFYHTSSINSDTTLPSHVNKTHLAILNNGIANIVYNNDGTVTINGNPDGDSSATFNRPRKPNKGYLAVYDADQLSDKLGGNNIYGTFMKNGNIDKLSNLTYQAAQYYDDGSLSGYIVKQMAPDEYGQWDASYAAGCWGLYFKDGYGSTSVDRLKKYSGEFKSSSQGLGGGHAIYSAGTYSISAANTIDVTDSNLYHFPAQIALNGSGNITMILDNFYNDTSPITITRTKTYFNTPVLRGDWLITNDISKKDLYGLKPVNGRSVIFNPLPFELALGDLVIPQDAAQLLWTQSPKGWKDAYVSINQAYSLFYNTNATAPGQNIKYFGNLWARSGRNTPQTFTDSSFGNFTSRIGVANKLYNVYGAPPALEPSNINPPYGGPNIIPTYVGSSKERSNVVGIIAAKATIDMPDGGFLSMTTTNNYGLQNYSYQTIAGGSIATTIIGALINFTQDLTGQSRELKIKQWGTDQDDKINSFGTTALWCRVCDHCPNTVYDGRYFAQFQFNKNDASVDFEIPSGYINSSKARIALNVGASVPSGVKIIGTTNSVRRGMLLSGGGFTYLKKSIGANPSLYQISQSGANYAVGNIVKFGVDSGTSSAAEFKVTAVAGANKGISAIEIVRDDNNNPKFGTLPLNSFENGPMIGSVTAGTADSVGQGAYIVLKGGIIYEAVRTDPEPKSYGDVLLSYPSNKGDGTGNGLIELVEKVNNFNLNKNSSGKYDIFFFFVNDILHTYTMYAPLYSYRAFAGASFVKLTINSA